MPGTATSSKGGDVSCPLSVVRCKKTEIRGRRTEDRRQTTKELIYLLATAHLAYRGCLPATLSLARRAGKAAPTETSFGGHRGPPYWILATDY